MAKRQPLTGVLRVEWVDGADPNDDSAPPNFGWFSCESEPPLQPERLLVLLRDLAAALEEDLAYETADPFVGKSPGAAPTAAPDEG